MKISEITRLVYIGICILIPLIFLLKFMITKRRKKNYKAAFLIASVLFVLLFSIKIIIKYANIEKLNCYLNNICETIEVKKDDNKLNNNTTEVIKTTENITSTTVTTTTSVTTTSTTTAISNNETKFYPKVAEIEGERVDKGTTSKGYPIYTINGITYIDGYMIVNKTYSVDESYVPSDTVVSAVGKTNTCNDCINKTVYEAWKVMKADAASLGLSIKITSGYRPYSTQNTLYNRYVSRDGKEAADTYSARPGSSEHQTALCFDLNSITDAFANTAEGKWVHNNAYKYGFIIRYPKGKSEETGYKYESWHLRYVGSELAEKLYNNGDYISMEDYFGITSKYAE